MLPKIPYIMEKNKSMTIPVGNLNLSSNFRPGDIADSYGISARRFPQLTNSKDKSLVYTGGNILGMTVFNGEIVTVRNENGIPVLYIGNEAIEGALNTYDYDTSYKRSFAGINTKLTVYPDQIYLEKVDGEWKATNLAASVSCKAVFGYRSITPITSTRSFWGYGGQIRNNVWSGNIEFSQERSGGYLSVAREDADAYIAAATKYTFGSYIGRSDVGISGANKITIEIGKRTQPIEETYFQLKETLTKDRIFLVTKKSDGTMDKMYVFQNIKVTAEKTEIASRDTYYTATLVGDFVEYESDELAASSLGDDFDMYTSRAASHGLFEGRYASVKRKNTALASGKISIEDVGIIKVSRSTKAAISLGFTLALFFKCEGWEADSISSMAIDDNISFDGDDPIVVTETPIIKTDKKTFEVKVKNIDGSNADEKTWDVVETVDVTIPNVVNNALDNFKKGDGVVISGSSFTVTESGETKTISNDITFVIDSIIDGILYASADIFTPHTYSSNITIERNIPYLDFICEKDNRLYGVNNSEKTVYVSALGDPTNMYAYEGVSTDSFAVAVGGEGDFTGCCKYAESVLFFKEDKIYKLVGSYPAEFALYSYDVDGLESGSEKSPAVINEVLYYKGKNGVFAYTGGIPSLISDNFGEKNFSNAAGGSDGVCYYLAAKDEQGVDKLLSFNTRLGLWVLETAGGDDIIDFVKTSSGLHYATSDGEVYKLHGSENVAEHWMVQFVPFYETIEGKKTYSRLLMRAELPRDSYMIIEVRSDDGPWCEAGKIVGANKGIIPIRLPIARCDKFEIRLRGKGEFVLHDILREYHVGSEV